MSSDEPSDIGGGSGEAGPTVREYLEKMYLSEGSLDWQGLGSGVIVGLFLSLWTNVIRIPQAIGEAFATYYQEIAGGITEGGDQLTDAITIAGQVVWDPFEVGALSLPLNIAAILAVTLLLAWGWDRVQS